MQKRLVKLILTIIGALEGLDAVGLLDHGLQVHLKLTHGLPPVVQMLRGLTATEVVSNGIKREVRASSPAETFVFPGHLSSIVAKGFGHVTVGEVGQLVKLVQRSDGRNSVACSRCVRNNILMRSRNLETLLIH